MHVLNVHERTLAAPAGSVAELIDRLASPTDVLWPHDRWPAMRFDRPLGVGAVGGHGPIRYDIEDYERGRAITFRFTEPAGFRGIHGFTVEEMDGGRARIRHTIDMQVSGLTWLRWAAVIRPLHDALIEDAFDKVERYLGDESAPRSWSWWVRFLRWVFGRGRRPSR